MVFRFYNQVLKIEGKDGYDLIVHVEVIMFSLLVFVSVPPATVGFCADLSKAQPCLTAYHFLNSLAIYNISLSEEVSLTAVRRAWAQFSHSCLELGISVGATTVRSLLYRGP